MSNPNRCVDVYGERLKVGDIVIPALSEAALFGFVGTISKIVYSKEYNDYYITITDDDGNVLISGANARYYTTQERFDEREHLDYVYSLTFFDNNHFFITDKPLTNRTDIDYEIPDDTCYIIVRANHFIGEAQSVSYGIYYFSVKNRVCYSERHGEQYLSILETGMVKPCICGNHKEFENEEALRKFVKELISYFNNADLTRVNNNELYPNNKIGHEFEDDLIKRIET